VDHTARILAQHARTVQLLGVDFVPIYRRDPEPAELAREPESAAASAAEPDATESAPAPTAPPTPTLGPTLTLAGSGPDRAASSPRSAQAPRPAAAPAQPSSFPISGGPRPAASMIEPKADPHATPPAIPADDPAAALAALEARYRAECPHKAFATPHTNVVFGEGNCRARLMLIGEAPGAEEDRQGRPFCGPSGQMLDRWIGAMGLARPDCYIANVLKVRPPNNATPTTEEARVSAPWLFEQIRIIAPDAIVTLGLPASRLLLGTTLAMGELRGRWWAFTDRAGREVPVMPTYHPAFLLRAHTPENRAKVWSDLQQVMELLGLERPGDR
jgi:uracil-DNA glycosylase family 4